MNKAIQERISYLENEANKQQLKIIRLTKELEKERGILISLHGGILELKKLEITTNEEIKEEEE